jgi:hypothetical protein
MINLRSSVVFTALFLCFFCDTNYSYARKAKHKAKHKIQDAPVADFRQQLFAEFPIPPTFENPCSQLCTYDQFLSEQYSFWSNELLLQPHFHRKNWEWCYILQVLFQNGKLNNNSRGLGFGVGREPLPAVLAKYGCSVVATDQCEELAKKSGWLDSTQYSSHVQELFMEALCPKDDFFKRVSFEEVDMNAIPEHLQDFDFTWSSCSLEHLGTLEKGLEFILNSLRCLKSGGVAVHTTEFNLSSNLDTVVSGSTVIYRKKDLDYLMGKIKEQGHTVLPLNLNPGSAPLDLHIDFPPYSNQGHLKLSLLNYISTSVGIIIIKN